MVEVKKLSQVIEGFNWFDLGVVSRGWERLTNTQVKSREVLSPQARGMLSRKGEIDLISQLETELQAIAQSKVNDAGSYVGEAAYTTVSAAVITVGVPMLFQKMGLNLWQNITASSLAALTGLSPTASSPFGIASFPWAKKMGGEIAKPFIVSKLNQDANDFLRGEGITR